MITDTRFVGYASVFDVTDQGGDVVRRGAFASAVAKGPGQVPLLWRHDPKCPIGMVEDLAEDARGLRVIGRLSAASSQGREAAGLLEEGAISGLSFGYRVLDAKKAGRTGGRELIALELIEISLVTFPMHPQARIYELKEHVA